jgi:hypothetical protein
MATEAFERQRGQLETAINVAIDTAERGMRATFSDEAGEAAAELRRVLTELPVCIPLPLSLSLSIFALCIACRSTDPVLYALVPSHTDTHTHTTNRTESQAALGAVRSARDLELEVPPEVIELVDSGGSPRLAASHPSPHYSTYLSLFLSRLFLSRHSRLVASFAGVDPAVFSRNEYARVAEANSRIGARLAGVRPGSDWSVLARLSAVDVGRCGHCV